MTNNAKTTQHNGLFSSTRLEILHKVESNYQISNIKVIFHESTKSTTPHNTCYTSDSLQNTTSTFFLVWIIFLIRKSNNKKILTIILIHELNHVFYAL